MADIPIDGKVKVYEVATIANLAAPTVIELNAGTQLEHLMTPDGLAGFEPDTAEVDTSALNSTFDTKTTGRASFSGTMLRLKKQAGTDAIYDTLVREYATHIVVRRDGSLASDAWTAADAVEVYPVICGEVRNLPPEANSVQRYEVPVLVNEEPELRAVAA